MASRFFSRRISRSKALPTTTFSLIVSPAPLPTGVCHSSSQSSSKFTVPVESPTASRRPWFCSADDRIDASETLWQYATLVHPVEIIVEVDEAVLPTGVEDPRPRRAPAAAREVGM